MKVIDEKKLILLGAPILEPSMEVVLRKKLQDLQLMVERLELLDAHDAWFLLKHCLAIPRLMYTLRCSPCYQQREVLEEYDHQLKIGLESILNLALEEQSWQQCVLPVKDGGWESVWQQNWRFLPSYRRHMQLRQEQMNCYQNMYETRSTLT